MDDTKIWVTKCLEWKLFKNIHPFLSSFILFGSPQWIGLLIFQMTIGNFSIYSLRIFYTILLASIWLAVGPYLIWIYDEKLLSAFFRRVEESLKSKEIANKLSAKYNKLFAKGFYTVTIIWCILLVLGYIAGIDYLEILHLDYKSPFFYIILIDVIWTGVITSIGFWGVFVTIKAIDETSKELKTLNPLHPDGLGGLSPFGYFAIGTTLLFSSGSLYIPLGMDIISRVYNYAFIFHILLVLYIFSIALSFFIPTYIVHKRADGIRFSVLKKIGNVYMTLIEKNKKDLSIQIRILNLRNLYFDYKAMHLYPMEIRIIIKLLSSILLPILIALIEYFIFK